LAEKQETAVLYRKEIKLPASLGDWTTYKPLKQVSKKIKPIFYGFHRVSREALEKTLVVHHFFTHDLEIYLKEALKASIDIYGITIEQLTYLEYLKRVTGGLMYNKLTIKGIGEVSLLIDYQLANIIINFSLGCQSVETKLKDLTDMEESILNSVFGKVLDKYTSCWGNVFEKPTFEIISYPNVQRETHINLNEVVTIVSSQISVANSVPALITFVYQNSVLRSMYESQKKKEEASPLNAKKLPENLLARIEIPIVAELGSTNISTSEISGLEDGDVISLDQKLSEPISIYLGYASRLKAQPGITDEHLSVRILGGTATKVRSEPTVIATEASPEVTHAETPADAPKPEVHIPATPAAAPEGTGANNPEEDFELPLEDESKEEYNESQENIFEEDNPQGLGGK